MCLPQNCEESLLTSNIYDMEFQEIIAGKPRRYTVSMLRSQRDHVLNQIRAQEEMSKAAVDAASNKVLSGVKSCMCVCLSWRGCLVVNVIMPGCTCACASVCAHVCMCVL